MESHTTPSYIHEQKTTYRYVGPGNLVLCLIIFLLNGFVVTFFYPRRHRLSALLFILIAASDILLACNEALDAIIGIICIMGGRGISRFPDFLAINLVYPSYLLYFCSLLYNTTLTVVKSLSIACPFYPINTRAIKVALLTITLLVISVTICDCVFTYQAIHIGNHPNKCHLFWKSINIPDFGSAFLTFLVDKTGFPSDDWIMTPMLIVYAIPNIIMLVSTGIQIRFIWINRDNAEQNHVALDEARHATVTIVLISTLFFLCNSVQMMYLTDAIDESGYLLPTPSLPLVNGAGYSVILICRGSQLRIWIREKITWCCRRGGPQHELDLNRTM